jgi:hypothetical protein
MIDDIRIIIESALKALADEKDGGYVLSIDEVEAFVKIITLDVLELIILHDEKILSRR